MAANDLNKNVTTISVEPIATVWVRRPVMAPAARVMAPKKRPSNATMTLLPATGPTLSAIPPLAEAKRTPSQSRIPRAVTSMTRAANFSKYSCRRAIGRGASSSRVPSVSSPPIARLPIPIAKTEKKIGSIMPNASAVRKPDGDSISTASPIPNIAHMSLGIRSISACISSPASASDG